MAIIIEIIVLGFIIWAVFSVKMDSDISRKGIVADAVVSRVDVIETINDNKKSVDYEKTEHSYTYFVKYKTQDGKEVEAKLHNAPMSLNQGSRICIKYLPDKPDYVIPYLHIPPVIVYRNLMLSPPYSLLK